MSDSNLHFEDNGMVRIRCGRCTYIWVPLADLYPSQVKVVNIHEEGTGG